MAQGGITGHERRNEFGVGQSEPKGTSSFNQKERWQAMKRMKGCKKESTEVRQGKGKMKLWEASSSVKDQDGGKEQVKMITSRQV